MSDPRIKQALLLCRCPRLFAGKWIGKVDRETLKIGEESLQFLQADPGLAIPPFTLSSWLTLWWVGKGAPFLRGTRTSLPGWWKGECSLERGRAHLKGGALKFAWLIKRGALTWEGRAQVCLIDGNECAPVGQPSGRAQGKWHCSLLGTYWFSIQYPDGVVQVVSTRGVAVSITGCRLKTRLPRIFFYRQPSRQASTPCPHPHAEITELSDAVFSTARKIQELK